jgi:hypothetical protein
MLSNLSNFKQASSKSKENVINRKANALLMNMEFISLVRQDFYIIFTRAFAHVKMLKKNPVALVK